MSAIIDTSKKYVKEFLKNDLPSTTVYHNYAFAKRLVKSTEEFVEKNNISANESEILVIASLFYTTGYTKSNEKHGPESVKIATDFLQANKMDQEQIDDSANNSDEFKKIFTKKSQFKEFIRFIKNGFKIK